MLYYEVLTHLYTIQRLKRAQGLPTRVVIPRVGYLTLPEYTGEAASPGPVLCRYAEANKDICRACQGRKAHHRKLHDPACIWLWTKAYATLSTFAGVVRMPQTKYTNEEIGRIGTEIYRRQIRHQVMPQYKGKFLILDIASGDYEIDEDDTSAEERLRVRRPRWGVLWTAYWLYVGIYSCRTDDRGRAVIHGVVNANLEATIPLPVVSPNGLRQEITAVIDTGYNGALSLPQETVIALALMPSAPRMVTLGDASQRVLDFYTANIHWEGQVRRIRVLCVEGSPLVGTVLLQGYKLEADFTPGGTVALTPLSSYPPGSSP